MLPVILDGVIAVLLIVAIFFAFRLRVTLKNIQEGRDDLKKIVAVLGEQIGGAQNAIQLLQNTTHDMADKLQSKISSAKGLTDELSLMNDAANSLADRLEKLASKNREIMEGMESARLHAAGERPLREKESANASSALFQIRDPDFLNGDAEEIDVEEGPIVFRSEAEKRLAEAMQKRQKGLT